MNLNDHKVSVMHLTTSLFLPKFPTEQIISSLMFCDTLIKPLGFIDCRDRGKTNVPLLSQHSSPARENRFCQFSQ